MRFYSQKELINEGFLDTVKGIAKGIGAAAKTAAEMAAPVTTGAIKDIVGAPGKIIGAGKEAYRKVNPISTVKGALKAEYATTFDPKSIREIKDAQIPGEPKGSPRRAVTFRAKRFKTIGSTGGGTGVEETYTAYVVKGPEGYTLKEIRDSQNRTIQGEKEQKKKVRPNWDTEYQDSELGDTPTVEEIGDWLTTDIGIYNKDVLRLGKQMGGVTDIYDLIVKIINNPNIVDASSNISANDISKVKQFFKSKRIVESSQQDTLLQVKLLAERKSHNK